MKHRLSIGLPVFNGERYVECALQSLLSQTFGDFEVIISDNASEDRTAEICRDYALKDPRIRVYQNEENRGLAWNCNRVFHLASGYYFKWAHHDDLCASNALEKWIEVLEADSSAVLSYSNAIIIDEYGNEIRKHEDRGCLESSSPHERFQNLILTMELLNHIFGVIRSDALRQTRLIGAYVTSDEVLLGELALLGRFHKIPEYLLYRRDHPMKANRAHPTAEELSVWYSPANKGTIPLIESTLFLKHIHAITRSRIPKRQKMKCYITMAKRLHWRRRRLRAEFSDAFKHILHLPSRPTVKTGPVDHVT